MNRLQLAIGLLGLAILLAAVGVGVVQTGYWLRYAEWPLWDGLLVLRLLGGDAPETSWLGLAAVFRWILSQNIGLIVGAIGLLLMLVTAIDFDD